MKKHQSILGALFLLLALCTCKKKDTANPYDSIDRTVPNYNPTPASLPEGSFAWLHANVFKPTCANSGCHDGTFEPEFRTMASAYNSLVRQPTISNDSAQSFSVRVLPGDANGSWLHERLINFVPNTSGIMPLVTEPSSDWPAKKTMYIQKITDWINAGAPDMYGNPAPAANAEQHEFDPHSEATLATLDPTAQPMFRRFLALAKATAATGD